jgi:hypothetical protein
MRSASLVFVLFFTANLLPIQADDEFCGIRNTAFQAGEIVTFKAFYSLASVYFSAGEAVFTVGLEQLAGKTVYHVTGTGNSNSFVDDFFKVRDKYETFIDTGSLQPYKFIRNVNEGGYKTYENITFNRTTNTAITTARVFKVPSCIQDVLSSIFYARNIDFNKYKSQDTIPFSMFLDNQVYHLHIRYLGKEIVKTRYGKFRAIKFKPLLIKGTIFEGGEKMNVWVSDDQNHLPLRIESPVTVGKIYADMMSYRNPRYPLTSLISPR